MRTSTEMNDKYPLSSPQREVWLNQSLHPNVPLYNVGGYVRINGAIDPTVFEKAIARVIQDNDALRLMLHKGESLPSQTFVEKVTISLEYQDFSTRKNAEKQAREWMEREMVKPFQIYESLLFQVALCKISDTCYYWFKKYHYLIADARTISLIVQRVAEVYNSLLSGKACGEQKSYSYRDFLADDRAYLNSEKFRQDKLYWLEKYASLPEPIFVREPSHKFKVQAIKSQRTTLNLSGETSERIVDFAQRNNTSISHSLLGILYCYLTRIYQKENLVIGITTENRRTASFEQTAGFFMNVLPVGLRLGSHLSFVELMQALKRQLQQVQEHDRVSISDINRELSVARTRRQQLFDIEFSYVELNFDTKFAGSPGKFIPLSNQVEQYPLVVLMEKNSHQANLRIDLDFSLGTFAPEEIERFQKGLEFLLGEVLRHPALPVRELPIMPEAELKKVLFEFNQTQRDYPADKCIHQLFEEQVERTPDAVAVVFEETSLTYQELNARANQLAHYLRSAKLSRSDSLGVGPEVLVGICVERSLDMVVGLLGILKAGGAYVPLDSTYPTERLAYMLDDSQVPVLLTKRSLKNSLPKYDRQVVYLDTDSDLISQQNQENPISGVESSNLAYVIYTSGSTGKPKGTMIFHKGAVNYLSWCTKAYAVAEGSGAPVQSSIAFDATITSLFSPLMVGQKVVLLPEKQEIEALCTLLRSRSNFSLVKITPAHLELLNQLLSPEEVKQLVKAFVIGGEALLGKSLLFWRTHAPETRVINEYGPTETVVGCCVYEVTPQTDLSCSILIGRPIANTQLYILDRYLQPVPIGVRGELYIGGAGVARGYLNRPELTNEKFIPNPFINEPEARLYKTGDLARWLPDGNIEFLGRIDNQVKVRGFRIELGEIEAVLAQHTAIQQAVVIAKEDRLGDKRLVAYVVPHLVNSDQVKQEIVPQLRRFLQEKLPEYMIPTGFVVLEKLPLTPNDKVDRQALAELPTDNYLLSEKTYIAPRNPEQEKLAQLWASVLDVEKVGIHDNFFELGGDSLKAIALLNTVQEQLGKTCQMVDLFNAPTIAEFAARLGEKPSSSQESIDRVPVSSNSDNRYYPPSFIQERFCLYQKVSNSYENPNYFHLAGKLDIVILQKSLNELIRRHEILRTTLQQVNGSLMQVVAPAATVDMSVVDLQSLPEQEQLLEVERLIKEEMQRSIALERDPWFRVTLMRLGEESHILLLCMHTLLVDGWSREILLQELSVLYEAFLSGKDSPLPSLPFQYGDYALTQRQSLTAEVLQAKLNYWQQWLSKEPPSLQFPCERPLPAVQTFRAEIIEYQLSVELTQQLKTLSQRKQATLFTTLVTALAIWLYRYSGYEDMVLGVPVTDRHHWQFKPLIGRMIKLLVLRIELGGNPSFWELLTQVQQQMLEAMANQDVPFEQVVKTLQPEAKRNKPLFRVLIDSLQEPQEQLKLPGLTVTSLPIEKLVMRGDMYLVISEKSTTCGTCLEGKWQYKKDLFETDTIARMAANFQTLLEAIVAAPERSVRELSLEADILEGGRR